MKKAAFFDRDGTIIKDVNYLSDIGQVELIFEVVDLCLDLQKKDYILFVVTNQSGIGRGFFDEKFVQKTHKHLCKIFSDLGVNFKKFYYCPHHPDDNCNCRKPKPGMLIQAACEFEIDLKKSLMFGDKDLDFHAGQAAGCKSFYIQNVLKNKKIATNNF